MLDHFEEQRIDTGGAELYVRIGGSGPPLVCLHGYPQTHRAWRHVAPALARDYTVVLPDLRGYGASEMVPSDQTHVAYSKRVMARDIAGLMSVLGFDRFLVAGHDRGGRVAYRLALDAPERVAALAVLDIIPTLDTWEAMDFRRAHDAYHWLFLAQPEPLPERLIGSDPRWYFEQDLRRVLTKDGALDAETLEAYLTAFSRPKAVHAACEDYRAGFTRDRENDQIDRDAGRRISMPLLSIYGAGADGKRYAHFPDVWKRWADDVTASSLPCGHFIMEELPEPTAAALLGFFAACRSVLA